jgi:hypothetical protein
VSRPGQPVEIRPLGDQPLLELSEAAAADARRDDLERVELSGRLPLYLEPPEISIDESGQPQALPSRMPASAGAPLCVTTLRGGIVANSPLSHRLYLLTAQGELVSEAIGESPNVWRRTERDWRSLASLAQNLVCRGEEVVLLGGPRSGYWHWWIDVLPRVWLLQNLVGDGTRAASLRFAVAPLQYDYQRESLDLLDLSSQLEILPPGLSQFSKVAFTQGLTGGGSRYPSRKLEDYAGWLRRRLRIDKPTRDGTGERRLFISRSGVASRRLLNEAELAPILVEHGYSVIDCGQMSMAAQVELFADAAVVIGPHGAGLTNLLFSKPGTRVVEIFAAAAAQDVSNYRVLASHLRQPYSRVLATGVPGKRSKSPHDFDMRLEPSRLSDLLSAIDR